MKVTAIATKNQGDRPAGMPVDTIILHADAAPSAAHSIAWIRKAESKVSYHALVDRDGTIYRFVETSRRAWACGESVFQGRANVNDFSVSLSFANRNDGKEPYTDAQYAAGAALAAAWMRLHPAITLERITTHAVISPGRKTDPLGFDMPRFLDLVRAELAGGTP